MAGGTRRRKETMRRIIIGLIALLSAFGLVAVNAPSAGALMLYNQPWHQGRRIVDWYAGYPDGCTTGPHFVNNTNGHFYMAAAAHCYEDGKGIGFGSPPFFSVYESDYANNKFDGTPVIHTQIGGAYEYYDVVLVDLGPASGAKSKSIFDYCNAGNCSSFYGGGSANCNWCGSWDTIIGSVGSPSYPTQVKKAGEKSGSSIGTVQSVTHVTYAGYDQWLYYVNNLNSCGAIGGDSGAPVYVESGSNAFITGMLLAGDHPYVAGAGNGCYPAGTPFGTNMYFISVDQIKAAFAFLGNVQPYT